MAVDVEEEPQQEPEHLQEQQGLLKAKVQQSEPFGTAEGELSSQWARCREECNLNGQVRNRNGGHPSVESVVRVVEEGNVHVVVFQDRHIIVVAVVIQA